MIPAYKGQVQIVEPEAGIFDPQMYVLFLPLLIGVPSRRRLLPGLPRDFSRRQ